EPGVDAVDKGFFVEHLDVGHAVQLVADAADEIGLGLVVAGVAAAEHHDFFRAPELEVARHLAVLIDGGGGAGGEQQGDGRGDKGALHGVAPTVRLACSQAWTSGTRGNSSSNRAPASRRATMAAWLRASSSEDRKRLGVLP